MKLHKKLLMSFKKNIHLLIGKRFYIKKSPKLTYLIDMRNRVDRIINAFSEYEQPQIDYFFSQLKTNNCRFFIDIGAHWGHYSMLIASEECFNQTEIHAFEPDKINRYQLYANLFLNKLHDRITVYDYALSSKDGELKFHHYDENNRGKSHVSDDGQSIVKTQQLDSIFKFKKQIVGIKIDVEGHEQDVIAGMTAFLKNNKCILQIESFSISYPALLTMMTTLGYTKINTIDSDHYFCN
ncbi:MAG: FkbM family methyltransferase [Gammaproteobacteria bacterium]|nr:FkbM family methyltransferase [Gammaproteobacteria bacterium]